MPEFTSMILRFRDLSTPAGTTTIAEHARIIRDHGHVWWGWWHKQGETVPEAAFRDIIAEIKNSNEFNVFLFDTGRYQFFRAKMTHVHWDNQLRRIETPDRNLTPNYYGGSHYLAWFELTSIDDNPVNEQGLHDWSYVRIDELFETKKSAFEFFYSKQVSSFKELRNQDRTIWFIRPKRPADAAHEIHVYDRSRAEPTNFPQQVVQTHSTTMLWVSDLHFSDDHHDFPRHLELARRNLSEAIRRDLDHQGITSVGALLISGDLTWRAQRPEFEWGSQFVDDIMSWSNLTSSHVIVCPGNHDLSFSGEPWNKGQRATQFGEESAAEYKRFYENLYEMKPTAFFSCGRRFWIPDGRIVDIVVHDAGALMRWLVENEVDLVLHGHMHLPALLKQSRALDYPAQMHWHEIIVAALGSSGVTAEDRPAHQTNSYALLTFGRDSLALTVRRITADDSIPIDQRELMSVMLYGGE
jgi:hypothetical protein